MLLAALLFTTIRVMAKATDKDFTGGKDFPSLLSNSSSHSPAFTHLCDSIFDKVGLLSFGLERDVFYKAYKGYQYLLKKGMLQRRDLLTICDYSQSSSNQRLYVIDLAEGKLLFNTFVSHGRNSGGEFATSFSNLTSSNKSSLGFMVTAEAYTGKSGLSMRFDGAEKGINDKVRQRDIVLHGSRFVSQKIIQNNRRMSNSLGCPAVPYGVHKQIIDKIKGGSCFYINHPDTWYTQTSPILNSEFELMPDVAVGEKAETGNSAASTPDSGSLPAAEENNR